MKNEQDLRFMAEAVAKKGNYVRKALESVMGKIQEIDPGQELYITLGVEDEKYGKLYLRAGSKDLYVDGQYESYQRLDENAWPWTVLDIYTIKQILAVMPSKVNELHERLWKLSQYQIPAILQKWIEITE